MPGVGSLPPLVSLALLTMAVWTCLIWLESLTVFAVCCALARAGSSSPTSRAMMATTTSSSTSVNARFFIVLS